MRIAIIHDWLTTMRGGEKVLEAICELYPEADLFTLYCLRDNISEPIKKMKITTSFIQCFPFAKKNFRIYLPLFPKAIERFNLTDYDLIFSTSHCVAKGIKKGPNALHICYCFTPMRYIWDFEYEYFGRLKSNLLTKKVVSYMINYLKKWDFASSSRISEFIAVSKNISNKIKKYYGRDSEVMYPPIDTSYFNLNGKQKTSDYFLIVSSLVPYKRIDVAIDAFNKIGERLKIVGRGPLRKYLENKANSNIEFLDWVDKETLKELYQNCIALICPQDEDFGIASLEVQACGRPVIAYAKGGTLETVIDGKTGVYFNEQTPDSLIKAIRKLEKLKLDAGFIRENSLRFNDKEGFKLNIKKFIEDRYARFKKCIT